MALVDDILGIGVLGLAAGVTFGILGALTKGTSKGKDNLFGIFGK